MKKRYIATIFSLVFLFGFLLCYHAWKFFNFNDKIESTIKRRLVAAFDDHLSVESVELDWGIVRIKNISFVSADHSIELWIENIDLEYELESFIFGGFRLKSTDKATLINNPRFTFVFSGEEDDSLAITKLDPVKTLQPLFKAISQYAKYVQPVEIANGEVFKKNAATGESSKLLEGINGSAEAGASGKALASLAGKPVHGKQYIVFHTALDFAEGRLDSLVMTLPDYQLTENISSFNIPYIVLENGVVMGEVKIKQKEAGSRLTITGSIALRDGRFHVRSQGIVLDKVQINTTIADERIHIHDTTFLLNGSPTRLTGNINGFLEPILDLYIDSQEFNVNSFVEVLSPKTDFLLSGTGRLQMAMKKSLQDPELTGAFTANELKLVSRKLNDVNLRFAFRDSVCTIREFTAKNCDSAVNGWGSIRFGENDNFVAGTVVVEGDFTRSLHDFFQFDPPSAKGIVLTEIQGTLHSPTINGTFAIDLLGTKNNKIDLRGNFDIREWDLTFTAKAKNDDFSVTGTVENLREQTYFSLNVENIALLGGVLNLPVVSALSTRYRLDAQLEGFPSQLQLQLKGYAKTSDSTGVPEFTSRFLVKETVESTRQIEGTINFYPHLNNWLSTGFAATYTDSLLIFTKLGNDRWLNGHLQIELHGQRSMKGSLKLQDVEIERLVEKNGQGMPKIAGRGFGVVNFAGTLENPIIDANGWIMDGYLNGLGVFNAEATVKLENNVLSLTRFDIKKNDQKFLQCKGQVTLSDGMADFRISGQNLDANTVVYAISGKDSVLTGKTNIALQLRGDTWPVPAYGAIELHKGTVLWFGFDELKFDLGVPGKDHNGSHLGNDGFYIGRIAYLSGQEFVAHGDGLFPFNKQDNMHVRLDGTGNFLSLLSDVAPNITKTRSISQLDLELLGPYNEIKLHNTHLQVYDGAFNLPPVVKEIKDITADIITEGDFIKIISLTGKIEDTGFAITNHREIDIENGREVEPLMIKYDWMNLGILELTTEAPGLPLHIPTMMTEGEIGRFRFRGQELKQSELMLIGQENQKPFKSKYGFILAGPWKHPLICGEVVLNYTNVTYPFLESKEPPSPVIVNLLMNADWDVRAIAGKDNNYIRNVNYGISNVYVNIGIDDQVSRLHFTGIAKDTSSFSPGEVELSMAPDDFVAKNKHGFHNVDTLQIDSNRKRTDPFAYFNKELKDAAGPDTSSFRIEGSVESTRGSIEYFDLIFRVDKFGAVWDKSELQPVLYGKAWATIPDSLNYTRDVFLKMYARDPVTGAKSNRGRMEDIYFDLESDYPIEYMAYDQSRVQLLDALGLALNDVRGQATELLTSSTDKVLLQQIVRPVERKLEKSLGLDIIRLNSRFTRNFLEMNQGKLQSELALALLRSTKLTIGKYLSSRMYLLYTGQVATWPLHFGYTDPTIGLRHTFGFEYRINPTLLLQMEYDYNSTLADKWKEDKRIWLRHYFPF